MSGADVLKNYEKGDLTEEQIIKLALEHMNEDNENIFMHWAGLLVPYGGRRDLACCLVGVKGSDPSVKWCANHSNMDALNIMYATIKYASEDRLRHIIRVIDGGISFYKKMVLEVDFTYGAATKIETARRVINAIRVEYNISVSELRSNLTDSKRDRMIERRLDVLVYDEEV